MKEELWKEIEGFPNYSISTLGRVKNNRTGRIRKTHIDYDGYECITLSYPEGHPKYGTHNRKWFSIHFLMAQAFIPNPEGKETIDHINRDRSDNRLENLRWVDWSENNFNKDDYKLPNRGKPVEQWSKDRATLIATYPSAFGAFKATGIGYTGIGKVCRGDKNRKSAGGYWWRYANEEGNDKC